MADILDAFDAVPSDLSAASSATAPTYDLIRDFYNEDSDTGELTVNPFWVVLVLSLDYPNLYNHSTGKIEYSLDEAFDKAVKINQWIVITSDCTDISVRSDKNAHQSHLSLSLVPNDSMNYLYEIAPGDHIFAWMCNNEKDATSVVSRLNNKANEQCNGFMDGLKFVGKVASIQKNLAVFENGAKSVRYAVTATGFNEFSASLYYDKYLMHETPGITKYLADVGTSVTDFISATDEEGGIPSEDMVVSLIDLLIGTGIKENLGTQQEVKATAGLEFDHSYIVPGEVGSILGKQGKNSYLRAADLLEVVSGVQKYSPSAGDTKDRLYAALDFSPEGTKGEGLRRRTGVPLIGRYPVTAFQFDSKPIWELLDQFVNPASSEMYVTLRANPSGDIVPTLILRQLPFTSDAMADSADFVVTKYTNLPRWIVSPELVTSVSLGRTDATRKNFVHITGWSEGFQGGMNPTAYMSRYQPLRDEGDIARNGLRPFIQRIQCSLPQKDDGEPIKWIQIMSDIVLGQQMLFSGSVELFGIQAPICIGDNLVFDDILFHIEGITHRCFIDSSNKRHFRTTLTLTHGVGADYLKFRRHDFADNQRNLEPGITSEGA